MAKLTTAELQKVDDAVLTCTNSKQFYNDVCYEINAFTEDRRNLIQLENKIKKCMLDEPGLRLSLIQQTNVFFDKIYSHYSEEVFGYFVPEGSVYLHTDDVIHYSMEKVHDVWSDLENKRDGAFKVGDKVKVLRAFESYEDGCQVYWNDMMSKVVGSVLEVTKIDDIGIRTKEWVFPYFVLEKVDDSSSTPVPAVPPMPQAPPIKPQPQKEIKMNSIKTVVQINGVDATTYTDDQIFDMIASTEKSIQKLEEVKNKPKKLDKKIAGMQASIDDLVKIVDAR